MRGKTSFIPALVLLCGLFCSFTPSVAQAESRRKSMRAKTIALSVFFSLLFVNFAFAESELRDSYTPYINLNIMDIYNLPDKVLLMYLIEPYSKERGGEYTGEDYPVYYRDMRLEFHQDTVFLEGDLGSGKRPYATFTLECKKTPENSNCSDLRVHPVKATAGLVTVASPHKLLESGRDVTRRLRNDLIVLSYTILNNQNKHLPYRGEGDRSNSVNLGIRAVYEAGEMNYAFTLVDYKNSGFVKFRFVTSEGVAEVGPEHKDPLRENGWIFSIDGRTNLRRYELNAKLRSKAFYPWHKGLSSVGTAHGFIVKIYEATAWRSNGSKVNLMPRLVDYSFYSRCTVY